MDSHAQYEIRAYAEIIGNEIVSRWVPLAWEAFMDYRFKARRLSALETQIIRAIAGGDKSGAKKQMEEWGLLKYREGKLLRNRERLEMEEKLRELGLDIPWRD